MRATPMLLALLLSGHAYAGGLFGGGITVGPIKLDPEKTLNDIAKAPTAVVDTVVKPIVEEVVEPVAAATVQPVLEAAAPVAEQVVKPIAETAKNVTREGTVLRQNIDETLTTAREDVVTEFNYFMATACGESSKAKALQRQYDQGEISREELEQRVKAERLDSKDCGGGVGYDSDDGVYIYDENGERAEKPPQPVDVSPPAPPVRPNKSDGERRPAEAESDAGSSEVGKHSAVPLYDLGFTATPDGQPLSPNSSNYIAVVGTPESGDPGGRPGFGRGVPHSGHDLPDVDGYTWTGPDDATVLTGSHPKWGNWVQITFTDDLGRKVTSHTSHLQVVTVRDGDRLRHGQQYGIGGGSGSVFDTAKVGGPHAHWSVKVDGVLVDPADGDEVYKSPD